MRNRPRGQRRGSPRSTRRVKPRAAVPVDPVGADERNRVQVADQAVLGDRQVARPPSSGGTTCPARSARSSSAISERSSSPLRHEHELSLRRRALQHLVRAASFGQRQALGHDRVDLALAEHSISTRKSSSNHSRSWGSPPTAPSRLVAVSRYFLDVIRRHPPAGRQLGPEPEVAIAAYHLITAGQSLCPSDSVE